MVFDPFSQVPTEQPQIQIVERIVTPEQQYILGIESRMFTGMLIGALIAIIFVEIWKEL